MPELVSAAELVSSTTFEPVVTQITAIVPIVLAAGMGVYALIAGAKFVPKAIKWFIK